MYVVHSRFAVCTFVCVRIYVCIHTYSQRLTHNNQLVKNPVLGLEDSF